MDGNLMVALAVGAFVGSHLLLSHPLRQPLVKAVGNGGFTAVYALFAFASLWWISHAYKAAPPTAPLWGAGDVIWAIGTLIMLVASVLLVGSLIGNPALPGPERPAPDAARGVYAITRHPFLWAVVLWAAAHILVYPVVANIIVAGGMGAFALIGAAGQDAKKRRLIPATWEPWMARTSFVPFAAIAAGRARFGGFRPHDLAGGVVVWLAATWAHIPAAGMPAGIWRWLGY